MDLLARLPQGLVVVDSEGRVVLSNALAEKWLAQGAREFAPASSPLPEHPQAAGAPNGGRG